MIENEIQTYFLLAVQKQWNFLLKSEQTRPWGVWIREYEKAAADGMGFSYLNVPRNVWFLDEKGFKVKDVQDFQRFIIVQSGLYWNELAFNSFENTLWSADRRYFHKIGIACFAPIEEKEDIYYFDYVWGGRFARGWHVALKRGVENAVWNSVWSS